MALTRLVFRGFRDVSLPRHIMDSDGFSCRQLEMKSDSGLDRKEARAQRHVHQGLAWTIDSHVGS